MPNKLSHLLDVTSTGWLIPPSLFNVIHPISLSRIMDYSVIRNVKAAQTLMSWKDLEDRSFVVLHSLSVLSLIWTLKSLQFFSTYNYTTESQKT